MSDITPSPFRIKEAWILTLGRQFSRTWVYHLLGLLAFEIKSLFLVPVTPLWIYRPVVRWVVCAWTWLQTRPSDPRATPSHRRGGLALYSEARLYPVTGESVGIYEIMREGNTGWGRAWDYHLSDSYTSRWGAEGGIKTQWSLGGGSPVWGWVLRWGDFRDDEGEDDGGRGTVIAWGNGGQGGEPDGACPVRRDCSGGMG